MEIEKAIKTLLTIIPRTRLQVDALSDAISALRAQQEREKCSYLQPCGWCSNFDKPCEAVCGRRLKEAQEDGN